MKQGKTHTPAKNLSGKGSGVNRRDSAVATPLKGGGTKVIDHTKEGHITRSSGSLKKYSGH